MPPPSASGSLDLNLARGSSSSGTASYEPPASRHDDAYGERRYPPEDACTHLLEERGHDADMNHIDRRHRDRDDRYPPAIRTTKYDELHRPSRDDYRGWDRDRDRDKDIRRDRDRDYDRRDERRPGRHRERSASPGSRRAHSPPSGDYEDRMTIETIHVGMVIGKGGDTLRRIERDTGARVQFAPGKTPWLFQWLADMTESQNRPGVRVANIFGSASQVNAARAAIRALVENSTTDNPRHDPHERGPASRGRDPNMGPGTNKFTFTVPDKCVGLIIGRGGESINEIQRKSGSRVNIVPESQSVNGRRPVNLFGSDEANERAKELIEAIVRQDELGVKKSQANNSDGSQRTSTVQVTASGHADYLQHQPSAENPRLGSSFNG